MERLRHHIKVAVDDSRDVIYWAEYDPPLRVLRVRDFNRPFGSESFDE